MNVRKSKSLLRVLLVDPDQYSIRQVRKLFTDNDYHVLTAMDADSAKTIVTESNVDIVVTELKLQHTTGLAFIRDLRELSNVPVLVLSQWSAPDDVVDAFRLGADDYVTKPYRAEELVWRVRALVRRYEPKSKALLTMPIHLNGLVLSPLSREVTAHGKLVKLSPLEYKLLYELVSHAGCVVDHNDLLTRVWGREYRDEREYLRVYIRYLRSKIERNPSKPEIIRTEPNVGYFVPKAEETETERELVNA